MRLAIFPLFLVAMIGAAPIPAQDRSVLIHNARVFDGTRMLGIRDVLVENGRISAIGKRLTASAGLETVDAKGRTLMPGLIDGHVHVFPGAQSDALRFGVTTVFDMYSAADQQTIDRWRVQRTSNLAVSEADTYTAGVGATPPGGHPMELFTDTSPGVAKPVTLAPDDDATAFMKARVSSGSDYIKVLQDDGTRPGQPGSLPTFSSQRFALVLQAAKATGKRVVVHVQQLKDARIAVANGTDALEHAICDAPVDDALIAAMKAGGIVQTATLATYAGLAGTIDARLLAAEPAVSPYLTQRQRGMLGLVWRHPRPNDFAIASANVGRLARAGVRIVAGTDAPNPTTAFGPSLHLELKLLVRAGLTPTQALVAATSAPAGFFGTTDRGRLAPGLKADMLLIDGDPTKDITATQRIVTIWKNGHVINRSPAS